MTKDKKMRKIEKFENFLFPMVAYLNKSPFNLFVSCLYIRNFLQKRTEMLSNV